jgi:deazaflavin-dependent oxidoreductase (nitroreductase family)
VALDPALADEDYCYLTTIGRVSRKPREIEIWFALRGGPAGPAPGGEGDTVYLLSGGGERSNWVKNLRRDARVSVRIAERAFPGRARVVADPAENARARELLVGKYAPRYSGSLDDWRQRALPVAIDLLVPKGGGGMD